MRDLSRRRLATPGFVEKKASHTQEIPTSEPRCHVEHVANCEQTVTKALKQSKCTRSSGAPGVQREEGCAGVIDVRRKRVSGGGKREMFFVRERFVRFGWKRLKAHLRSPSQPSSAAPAVQRNFVGYSARSQRP